MQATLPGQVLAGALHPSLHRTQRGLPAGEALRAHLLLSNNWAGARARLSQPDRAIMLSRPLGRRAALRPLAAAMTDGTVSDNKAPTGVSDIGVIGLAVMGQNLALNIASKGIPVSVYNRSYEKTEAAVRRADKEGLHDHFCGFKDLKDFVASLKRPRSVIILVKAGAPVDATIDSLLQYMEPGDIIIDGGNEWYQNTERRMAKVEAAGVQYMGMGVSGGEEGARNGPALMPGGPAEAYAAVEPVLSKVSAQVDDGPCVTHVGPRGSGNYVKMVHNGIEYGDMQLIAEAYDVLKNCGGLTNNELAETFDAYNKGDLDSFLVEITAQIFSVQDDHPDGGGGALVDKILDKTGMKGTGKWTVQEAADLSVPAPTMEAALDARFMSGRKDERVAAAAVFAGLGVQEPLPATGLSADKKKQLVADVAAALYCSKICSYAQGMNLIKAKSQVEGWGVDMGSLARIWKGGCIIRASFLDSIKQAYYNNPELPSLLVDPRFARELADRQGAWRRVVVAAVQAGVAAPGITSSLAYFDAYRRSRLPANLVQAQRDFFGSHTYERTDMPGAFHTVWSESNSADSITTSGYIT